MLSSLLDDEISLFGRGRLIVRRKYSASCRNVRKVPAAVCRFFGYLQPKGGSRKLSTKLRVSFSERYDCYRVQ